MRAWWMIGLLGCAPVLDDRPDFDGDGIPDAEDEDADGDGIPDVDDDFVDLDSDGFDRRDDCDDADAAVNPGATEVCGNGKDDDCDGSAGECRREGDVDLFEEAGAVVRGPQSTDALGRQIVLLGDADGDGSSDLLVGAGNAGVAWRFAGDDSGRLTPGRAAQVYVGDNPGYATSISGGGDLTGDGRIDVVLGEPFYSDSRRVDVGRVEIRGIGAGEEPPVEILGRAAFDTVGTSVHIVEDVDRDGRADLWTFVGDAPALLPVADGGGPVEPVIRITPARDDSLSLPAAGDLDGDSLPDLLLQAADQRGVVFLGPPTGSLSLSDADFVGVGGEPGRAFQRWGAVVIEDLDGDGYDDAIIEQGNLDFEFGSTGAVRFVAGNAAGADLDARTGGIVDEDGLGVSRGLTRVGDLDLDGRPELLVGLSTGGVAAYYDLVPGETRSVSDSGLRFPANPQVPVEAFDVSPDANLDATVSLAFGFPQGAGEVYVLRLSGL